jgi:hypothetical protein
MKRQLIVMLSVMVLAVMGCTPLRPAMKEVPIPPHIVLKNGYSLVPLDEPGWLIAYEDSEKLVLGRRAAANPDETFVIRSFIQVLPPLKSDEEFIGFSKSVLVMVGAKRNKILSQDTMPLTIKGQSCVRNDTVLEDHAAVKRTSRSENMVIESYALLCKHPNNGVGILLEYSHRCYPENRDPDSAKKAKELFDSIGFYDF